ncbi:MAG: LCP family protein [Clostridia bacterium]|nr:LCP family protein [Clostridia bacterium]
MNSQNNEPNNLSDNINCDNETLSQAATHEEEPEARLECEEPINATTDATASKRPGDYAVPPNKKRRKNTSTTDSRVSAMDDADDFIFARYHGKKSHSYSSNHEETVVRSSTEQHHRHRKHHHGHHGHHSHHSSKNKKWKKRPIWQKILIIIGFIFAGIASLLLIGAITLAVLNFKGLIQLTDYKNLDMTAPDMDGMSLTVSDSGRSINYKGQEYLFNEDITSILCIGVDKHELGLEDGQIGTAGQGDALYLIALNTATGKTDVITVPRDIVTDIGIYSPEGEYLRTEKMQICLAYAYGDGRKTSCTNTVTAVSRLFYQLPINSYFSMNLSAIGDLNDAVGGVTVTMIDDSFYDINHVHHYKGETLTLHGDNARKYLQQREVSELESSLDRLDRQVNYLKAFSSKALEMTKSDITTPIDLYSIVKDNSETNLTTAKMTAFATCLVSNGISELDFKQVPGEITSGGTYAEYIVDEEALYEMILDTYYTPVEN